MSSHEPYVYPDVVISGSLAMALVDVVEYARLRTHEAEDTARAELDAMADALDAELRDAGPPVAPMRWVVGVPPEDTPEGVTVLDEVPRVTSGSVQSFEITSHADPSHAWLVRDLAGTIRRTRRLDGRPYLR